MIIYDITQEWVHYGQTFIVLNGTIPQWIKLDELGMWTNPQHLKQQIVFWINEQSCGSSIRQETAQSVEPSNNAPNQLWV